MNEIITIPVNVLVDDDDLAEIVSCAAYPLRDTWYEEVEVVGEPLKPDDKFAQLAHGGEIAFITKDDGVYRLSRERLVKGVQAFLCASEKNLFNHTSPEPRFFDATSLDEGDIDEIIQFALFGKKKC